MLQKKLLANAPNDIGIPAIAPFELERHLK